MIEAVIVEDKKRNAEVLTELLKEYCPEVKLTGSAHNVKTALEVISNLTPSLVFLDVEMPDGTAFDLLEKLPEKSFHVIFTTAYDHYALKAIKFSALDYLLKPINFKELQAAVEKVRQKTVDTGTINNISLLIKNLSSLPADKSLGKIAFPTMEGHIFVNVNDIIRMEAENNYTFVFLTNGKKIVASRSLKEFEDFIDKYNFVRIHRAHLINMQHIERYVRGNGGHVIMVDGSTAEVSVRKKDEFLRKMAAR